ncbi:MAG: C40 family peptidase [Proteobacteria bacterium]|nr:C40 family peptidase [Pseudomonadota bacterium]
MGRKVAVAPSEAPAPAPASVAEPSVLGRKIAQTATSYVGTPYRYGGEDPGRGFDCSGLAFYIFGRYGYSLPRRAREQSQSGHWVSRKDLAPGDLVFFRLSGKTNWHVGIFIGDGRFVHAPRRGRRVEIQRMDNSYYRTRYYTARRVIDGG